MTTDEPACPSCGVPYTEHPGLTLTCNQLQLARKRITDLQDDIVLQSAEIENLYADLAEARHERNVAARKCAKKMLSTALEIRDEQFYTIRRELDDVFARALRLFHTVAPQCKPLPTVTGLLTQLDNFIAGQVKELAEAREDIELHKAVKDGLEATINRLTKKLEAYEPKPGHCEHGVEEGDWCEPCNRAYKEAAKQKEGE